MVEGERVVRVMARTLDEARRRAAQLLHVAPSTLEAEVTGARRTGLFGLGSPKLEVLLWVPETVSKDAPDAAHEADGETPPAEPTPSAAWQVRCERGECFLDVGRPGPWLVEVEDHILSWPLDEYHRDAVRQVLSGADPSPVRFGRIAPLDEAGADRPFFVKISRDGMTAWAVPGDCSQVDVPQFHDELARAGVDWGIDHEAVDHAAESPLLEPVMLASGTEALPSRDAAVEYLFSEEDELDALRPRLRDDGTVDYRDLKPIYTVQPGTVVGHYLPAVNGEPGRDVLGREIAPVQPGRDTPAERFAGRDVEVAVNGIDLVATKAGRPVREGDRIDVVEIYTISGDVDYSTGNIDFNGEVYVSGDVQPGFTVKASGNVRIDGMVDTANVESGKDLLISGGIHGHGESKIVCGGEMSARFIEAADVSCEGNVLVISTVVRATVTCRGFVTVIGRGSIVGGKVKAVNGISCNTAGSPAGVGTSLELDWIGAIHPGPDRERELRRYRAARIVIHRDVFPGTVVTINGAKFPVQDPVIGVSFQAAGRGIALASARDVENRRRMR
jgi:hypothetical protein